MNFRPIYLYNTLAICHVSYPVKIFLCCSILDCNHRNADGAILLADCFNIM